MTRWTEKKPPPLRLKRLDGNKAIVGKTVTKWYRLPGQRWSWRSEAERDSLILDCAERYSELVNHRLHWRTVTRPSTAADWEARLLASSPNALPGWNDHLRRCVQCLDRTGVDLSEKQVFLGVDVAPTTSRWSISGLWAEKDSTDIDTIIAGPGFEGRPATSDEIEWLFRSSVLLGHIPTATSGIDAPWEETDLPEITDAVHISEDNAYDRAVSFIYEGVERFVVTSVIGRTQVLHTNNAIVPWLAAVDKLPYPVQISATLDIVPAEQMLSFTRKKAGEIRAQIDHIVEHKQPVPHHLPKALEQAMAIQDEIEQGQPELSIRAEGWYRLSVSGATEDEARSRAKEVERLFAPKITIVHPAGQYHLAREFIPGETLSCTSHRRQMPLRTAAAAMPTATASVGHSSGFYLGHTVGAGGQQAVFWDPWRSTEKRERSGLAVCVGGLGSGKTSLMSLLAYQAALSGVQTTILDPSGALAPLCRVPELAGRARHIDLLHAQPGQLNPWRVIPDPVRANFDSDEEFRQERSLVNGERQTLATDILQMMLPPQIARHEDTLIALQRAAQVECSAIRPSMGGLLATLHAMRDSDATDDAVRRRCRVLVGDRYGEGMLGSLTRLPAAQLIFDNANSELDHEDGADPVLTVFTMLGLEFPDEGANPESWTTDERLSLACLSLTGRVVQRSVYRGDRNRRKLIDYEEGWLLDLVSTGQSLLHKSVRETRKFNSRVLFSSQNPGDFPAAMSNLIDAAFVGHTEDPDTQKQALRLLKAPENVGFEAALATLNPHARGHAGRSGVRHFVINDGEGGIERVSIDLTQMSAAARAALDSTADPTKTAAKAERLPVVA